jgi:hypothetical protein
MPKDWEDGPDDENELPLTQRELRRGEQERRSGIGSHG